MSSCQLIKFQQNCLIAYTVKYQCVTDATTHTEMDTRRDPSLKAFFTDTCAQANTPTDPRHTLTWTSTYLSYSSQIKSGLIHLLIFFGQTNSLPSSCLVNTLRNEVSWEWVIKLLFVLEWIMLLGIWHTTTLKPAIKHLCNPM